MGSKQVWGTGEMALSAFQQHVLVWLFLLQLWQLCMEDRNIIYFTVRYRREFNGPVYVEGRGETRGFKAIFHLQRGRNYVCLGLG